MSGTGRRTSVSASISATLRTFEHLPIILALPVPSSHLCLPMMTLVSALYRCQKVSRCLIITSYPLAACGEPSRCRARVRSPMPDGDLAMNCRTGGRPDSITPPYRWDLIKFTICIVTWGNNLTDLSRWLNLM